MEFMGTGMLSTLGCGCCCLAVVVVVGIAGLLGMRGRGRSEAAVGVPAAPERGSSTNARLTHMENAHAAPSAPPAPQRSLPREVVDTAKPPTPSAAPSASPGPRVIPASPTFVPPADED